MSKYKNLIMITIISCSTIGLANATERVVLEDLTPEENKSAEVLPEYKILDDIKKAQINSQLNQVKNVVINNGNNTNTIPNNANNHSIKEPEAKKDNKKEDKKTQKSEITVEQKKELINSIKKEIKEENVTQEKDKEKSKVKEAKQIDIKESESCFPGNKTIEGNNLKLVYLDNCIQLVIKGNNNNIQIKGAKNVIVEGSNNVTLIKENIENGIHVLGSNNKLITQTVNSIIVDGDKNTIKWKEKKEDKNPRVRLIGLNNVAELNGSN